MLRTLSLAFLTPVWPHWLSAGLFIPGGTNEQWTLPWSDANQTEASSSVRGDAENSWAPVWLKESRTLLKEEKKAIRQLQFICPVRVQHHTVFLGSLRTDKGQPPPCQRARRRKKKEQHMGRSCIREDRRTEKIDENWQKIFQISQDKRYSYRYT